VAANNKIFIGPQEGAHLPVLDITHKVTKESFGGAFTIIEVGLPPGEMILPRAALPAGVCFSVVFLAYIVVDFTDLVLIMPLIPSWMLYEDISSVGVYALLVVPVFTYIAILRYRLYDIGVVINRTLAYGTLTVLLAAMYFSGVATIEAIIRALTGQEQQPQLAIVASTLAVAALFNPLRHRIQAFIDRRFYRSKYDARKTLEAFSSTLRDETDLEALRGNPVGVVRETMQPAHASVWLRPYSDSKGEQAD
jgi:hypothetical protein